MKQISALFRSTLFAVAIFIVTPPYAVAALLTFPFPPLLRYRIISGWSWIVLRLARWLCGIRYRVEGLEKLPAEPSVIFSKHQSAWETLAFQWIFPPQVWVLKRELLMIPFFGWGLAMTSPVAIDRGSGRRAIKQILQQGTERLRHGFWITVFPEGTRIAPGKRGKYRIGGVLLAAHAKAPLVPVAHNAGECWPRNGFIKYPGIITVRVGPALYPEGSTAEDVLRRAQMWIEGEMRKLNGRARAAS